MPRYGTLPRAVKLFAFDDADERLDLLPMAARRALDVSGLKLSLESWRSLDMETRRLLVEYGALDEVPREEVQARVGQLAKELPVPPAPNAAEVMSRLGDARPLPAALWRSLSALERYVLSKVAHDERIEKAYDEIVGARVASTHLDAKGNVHMVDVGSKAATERSAVAETRVELSEEAMTRLVNGTSKKGDVLATVRLAGILAAKKTSDIVPLCHPLSLTHVSIDVELEEHHVRITAKVATHDRTGVEMEAMTAASVAALTLYDMLKAYDRGMQIGPTRLLEKSGGKSGDFRR
jgi:cyclic pyranopterin monophosphate synthase